MRDVGYEPIDTGGGRRLERFGAVIVDRPAPAATGPCRDPGAWSAARARFDRGAGGDRWTLHGPLPDPWLVRFGGLVLEARTASAGQVGIFPEQEPVWQAVADGIARWPPTEDHARRERPSLLSLFAYTGAGTLAGAVAGASVVHVDASRTAVAWARRNAEWSEIAGAPIRWIVDDARSFVSRELRRGHRFEAIVLDPPTYGHGSGGHDWRIERDLEALLADLAALLSPIPAIVALSAHSPGFDPPTLAGLLGRMGPGRVASTGLSLEARSGAHLDLGAAAWWCPG